MAVRLAFLPSTLASITTSLGFLSLCTSVLLPIRSFGYYSALLVPLNTLIVITVLAIHAKWSSMRTWRFRKIDLVQRSSDPTQRAAPGVWARWIVPLLKAQPTVIVAIWLVMIIAVGAGVSRLSTSAGTHKLLSPEDKLVRDYAWLEEHVGALVPVELVVRFQANSEQTPAETFNAWRRWTNCAGDSRRYRKYSRHFQPSTSCRTCDRRWIEKYDASSCDRQVSA